jgi:hypothetical protein
LIKWKRICKPKKKGGWGLKISRNWTSAYCASGDGSWSMKMACGNKLLTPNIWMANLFALWVTGKQILLCGQTSLRSKTFTFKADKSKIGDGKNTLFRKDSWLDSKPLCILFPDLFKIYEQPDIAVFHAKLASNG